MTTVAQMIEWLKTLPQDAEVECGDDARMPYMVMRSVDIDSCYVLNIQGKIIVQICGEQTCHVQSTSN
jgi:NADH:ubiquinone oxidoreductase subunit E